MGKVITILSGKGGVGKTTTGINLATLLTNLGGLVTIVEGNLSSPNLALHLGSPNVENTLHDVMNGDKDTISRASKLLK